MLAARMAGASAAELRSIAAELAADPESDEELAARLEADDPGLQLRALNVAHRLAEADPGRAEGWSPAVLGALASPDFAVRLPAVRLAALIPWPEGEAAEAIHGLRRIARNPEEGPFVRAWALTALVRWAPQDRALADEIESLAQEWSAGPTASLAARARRILRELGPKGTLNSAP